MIRTPEILYFSQHLRRLRLLGFHHDDSFDILCTLLSSLGSLECTSPAWSQPWSETRSSEVSHLGVQWSIPCGRYSITPGWPISILSHKSTHDMLATAGSSLAWLWPLGCHELLHRKPCCCCGTNHGHATSGPVSIHLGTVKDQYLVIFIMFGLCRKSHWACFVNFILRDCRHWPFFVKFLDNVRKKFFCSKPSFD